MPVSYLLVGEAPAADPTRFFLEVALALKAAGKSPPGRRVDLRRDLAWLSEHHPLLNRFALMATHANLLREHPGAGRKGSHFPVAEARNEARRLRATLEKSGLFSKDAGELYAFNGRAFRPPSMVLLAGLRVSRAFGIDGRGGYFNALGSLLVGGVETSLVIVPHPSGVNRWWNAEGNRERAREFLEELGRRAP